MAVISLTYYSYLLNPLVVSWASFSSEHLKARRLYFASLFLLAGFGSQAVERETLGCNAGVKLGGSQFMHQRRDE